MDTVRSAVKLEPNDLTCDDSCADASDTTDKFTADDDGDDEQASFHLVNLLIPVSCFAFLIIHAEHVVHSAWILF